MSGTLATHTQAVDPYNNTEFLKQQNFDFFSFLSPTDIVAPHPDLFESDIDSNLAAFTDHLQLLTVDSNDAYNFFRTEKPEWQGPLSTITVSSDSYDTLSSHSESFYNEPVTSKLNDSDNCLFDFNELGMDFQRVGVGSDYASMNIMDDATDPTSFGTLPPTPPTSPPTAMNIPKAFEKPYTHRNSYSDCGAPRRRSMTTSSDYYPSILYTSSHGHPTVSPCHISNPLPTITPIPPLEEARDPRKKYKCTACPRGTTTFSILSIVVYLLSHEQPLREHTI